MDCTSVHHTLLFILLALLVGQGDGRWKKSNREMLQHDIKLFKKMTERIKEELGSYYDEYSDEPFADYFFEEIDYLQSKIENTMKKKMRTEGSKDINYSLLDYSNDDINKNQHFNKISAKDRLQGNAITNVTLKPTDKKFEWPSFEDILTAMGKKYDWKNDRWIKINNKVKDKEKIKPDDTKMNVEKHKHNFRYRIVKLNRTKSKRNIVIAVTAVR